ncbi:MAG: recombination protein RecA, partial [Kribbellaceae bacterium]|nr:recombination protein RecA [Kribbellaceae bacterium]
MAGAAAKDDRKVADREKALATALTQIERNCGKGAVMRLGDQER